jgi:hypothetical protein
MLNKDTIRACKSPLNWVSIGSQGKYTKRISGVPVIAWRDQARLWHAYHADHETHTFATAWTRWEAAHGAVLASLNQGLTDAT